MCLKQEGKEVRARSTQAGGRGEPVALAPQPQGGPDQCLLSSQGGGTVFTFDPVTGAPAPTWFLRHCPHLTACRPSPEGSPKEEPVVGHCEVEDLSRLQGRVDEPVLEKTCPDQREAPSWPQGLNHTHSPLTTRLPHSPGRGSNFTTPALDT